MLTYKPAWHKNINSMPLALPQLWSVTVDWSFPVQVGRKFVCTYVASNCFRKKLLSDSFRYLVICLFFFLSPWSKVLAARQGLFYFYRFLIYIAYLTCDISITSIVVVCKMHENLLNLKGLQIVRKGTHKSTCIFYVVVT